MPKKPEKKITVLRKGEVVDRNSTEIRSDQAAKLKMVRPPNVRISGRNDPAKLITKEPEAIYFSDRIIKCESCEKMSPTKRMYVYRKSNRGTIGVCEDCIESVEKRSFDKLDAMDKIDRKFRKFEAS